MDREGSSPLSSVSLITMITMFLSIVGTSPLTQSVDDHLSPDDEERNGDTKSDEFRDETHDTSLSIYLSTAWPLQ